MTFISYPPGAVASSSTQGDGLKYLTRAGGITIVSPDGVHSQPHLVVEAPPAPLAVGEIDLSITTEQSVRVDAGGLYLADTLVMCLPTGAPGSATVAVRTLDAARGGGRLLVSALAMSGLDHQKAAVSATITVAEVLRVPHLYVTVAAPGTGTAKLLLYGRLVALEDPNGQTYDPERVG